jgi:dienelactone hydrolase
VLTWNVGLHHRIGPHRFYVELSRRLAAAGFTTLRFDVSGLGDSEPRRDDARPDGERHTADVRAAMDFLRSQRGFQRFVPVGFCSSVDAAHVISVADEDVAGVVYLEGYAFRTRGFYMHYPKRFLNRNRWERLLRNKYPHLFGHDALLPDPSLARERVFIREYPTQEKLRRDVRSILARGTRMLFVYVGGDTDYAYRDQLFEMLDGKPAGNLEVVFYPEADHTFFLRRDRDIALDRVTTWMTSGFGAPAAERSANGAKVLVAEEASK